MKNQMELRSIYCSYGERDILENIDLAIESGGFISIAGQNGSGKTTLLKVLSSVLKPKGGAVLLEDRNLSSFKPGEIASKIGVVPQDTSVGFEFKVFDIVMMGRHPYIRRFRGETPHDVRVVEEAMEITGTGHLKDRSFNELSGGEKQRVIIARALAQEPKVLLLDEPVSHLDLQYQLEILNLLKKMSREKGLTIIIILHDLNLASAYSDLVLLIDDKKIKAFGTPQEVLTAQNIREVFNIEVQLSLNPASGRPLINPLLKHHGTKAARKIHVICGGGSGLQLLQMLHNTGHDLSAGVLNIGDSDWKICREFNIPVAEEAPFAAISDQAYRLNIGLAQNADFILLSDPYFGAANIRNLELLLENEISARTLITINDQTFGERDFSGGRASELYNRIKNKFKIIYATPDRVLDLFENGLEEVSEEDGGQSC